MGAPPVMGGGSPMGMGGATWPGIAPGGKNITGGGPGGGLIPGGRMGTGPRRPSPGGDWGAAGGIRGIGIGGGAPLLGAEGFWTNSL